MNKLFSVKLFFAMLLICLPLSICNAVALPLSTQEEGKEVEAEKAYELLAQLSRSFNPVSSKIFLYQGSDYLRCELGELESPVKIKIIDSKTQTVYYSLSFDNDVQKEWFLNIGFLMSGVEYKIEIISGSAANLGAFFNK